MAAETINSEVQLVFRKKTRGQVIGTELQEGFAHIGAAATEAGRLAAEQLGPRVAAAREAAGPALDAAQKAVAPKVAAAVAVAAPAVASARDAVVPRVDAARDALAPRVEAAQAAAAKAAADLAPRVEAAQKAAQKAIKDDVVPRLVAAETAALAYATPRVTAAREAVTPALESARETLAAGVDSARSELDARRAEFVAAAEKSTRKARKAAKKARKKAGRKHKDFEKAALATAKTVKRTVGVEKEPRRWPWVFVFFAVGTAVFVLLRRKKDDAWTPAPAGDGPVPSYREDPVPSSPSESGKTVSTAMETPSDSAPPESDMGMRDAQLVKGDGPDDVTPPEETRPEPFSSGGGAQGAGPTAGPDDKQV
ncbi:hypothetical protein E4P40_03845 [Blastococcus sp. CT_GayMR20]|uniref:hypothetical protein n=1 Tax=Blastococcus sp. CT_GayMR20 TaxID=2559609 RepID=UPI0010748D9D|nr:hypothetical protein [Blastococcus sp. CT_GayMR20]TFV92078.1 hypothetical protein E4P40_03845 [Blastococcus sp. CT_GayMR20]